MGHWDTPRCKTKPETPLSYVCMCVCVSIGPFQSNWYKLIFFFLFSFQEKRKIENVQKENSDKGKDKWQ